MVTTSWGKELCFSHGVASSHHYMALFICIIVAMGVIYTWRSLARQDLRERRMDY